MKNKHQKKTILYIFLFVISNLIDLFIYLIIFEYFEDIRNYV